MRFSPVRAFKDPAVRPRAIMFTGIAVILFIVVWAVALDGTSTYFFCTQPCHIVHDDNTLAYNAGSHSRIACVACHEPVNANPLQLTLLKIEVAPDAISTIRKTFELPMNHDNHIALEMPSEQCTQCHNLDTRSVTPSSGVIIDHAAHAENKIVCTKCHNRVAHPEENITLILEGDMKHENWMTMDACFRCHSLAPEASAPGTCTACHPANFDLTPATHDAADWYHQYGESAGHAKAAKAETEAIEASKAFFEERPPTEASHGEVEGEEPTATIPSSQVNSCYTCHQPSFCSDCHKLEMPHPAEFKKTHGPLGKSQPQVCANCHARSAEEAKGTAFCNACHHPASTPGTPWVQQHPAAVKADGAQPCLECHETIYCETCHVSGPAAAAALAEQLYKK